ncbi:MAG: DEAD/DEAH box helicase [Ignavibacteria bacterium]|nr:DEAD/DEAH box helicase [Ignavibacteria bacterium]
MKTEEFNLSEETLARLERNNITIATPVQKKIIPAIISGRDILAQSETGSGKTLSFAIPIIESIDKKSTSITALILVPTRELCVQIAEEFVKFANRKIGISSVYGGVSIDKQIFKLRRSHVVVATPGRLLDIMHRKAIKLNDLKFLVFDEADRMLDMGFIADIENILTHIPEKRQTMLFSATISKEISGLTKKYLNDPVKVSFESSVKPEFLKQTYYRVTKKQKPLLLVDLLMKERDLVLIFCNRKRITEELADELKEQGLKAACLNGDMTQAHREKVTRQFKEKKFNILIATDVASRGLHIEDISHVYNYEIPRDVESYTHRIGRTARAGKKGEAISFVTGGEDEKFFRNILFTYKGIITMKYADKYPEPPKEERSRSDKPSRYDRPYSERRRDDKRSSFKKDREPRSERGSSRDAKPFSERRSSSRDEKPYNDRRSSSREGKPFSGRRRDDKNSSYGKDRESRSERRANVGKPFNDKRRDDKENSFGKEREQRPDRRSSRYEKPFSDRRRDDKSKSYGREREPRSGGYEKKFTGRSEKNFKEEPKFKRAPKTFDKARNENSHDFEKSLLEEISKLRELPFKSEEGAKKKSFRDFRTADTTSDTGKKRNRKEEMRNSEESFRKKKNWFDKFRKRR